MERFLVLATTFLFAKHALAFPQVGGMTAMSQLVCPETSSCECGNIFSEFEIQCPMFDPKITVRIKPGDYIHIHCLNSNESVYDLIPEVNAGETVKLQIQGCPLFQSRPLLTIAEKFNATRIRTLIFQSFSHSESGHIRREHLAGFKDLQRLLLSDNSLGQLPADLFDDLVNLNWLQIKSNPVELPRDIFSKLEKLQVLELALKLQHMEDGLFRNQKELRNLGLWGNKLHNLTSDSFRDVTSVTDLDLSLNNIESLDPEVFISLTSLRNLNLNTNNFSSLPEGLLSNNTELVEFKMLENRQPLETLPAGMLANLPKLETVMIKCGLRLIPADTFTGSVAIRTIVLANNQLETLPSQLFAHQERLEKLTLAGNRLAELDNNLFKSTRALQTLDLSFNQLFQISSGLFARLEKLDELRLGNNNLHYVDQEAFYRVTSLEHLYMENNHLSFSDDLNVTDVPLTYSSPFQNLNRLRTLILRNNSLTHIFEDWTLNNVMLEELDLSLNQIAYLSTSDFQFLAENVRVDLRHNHIEEIDLKGLEYISENTTRMSPVEVLLDNNPLDCNCVLLHFVQFLRNELPPQVHRMLKVSTENLFCTAPAKLKSLPVKMVNPYDLLCSLDMPSTTKKMCPDSCDCKVRTVDRAILVNCSNGELNAVPSLPDPKLEGLDHIELDVSDNHIKELPKIDGLNPGYPRITRLLAQNNNISILEAENIPNGLQVLHLSNNELSFVNVSVLEQLNRTTALRELSLSQNPWSCSCESINFLIFVQSQYKKINDLEAISCADGELMSVLTADDFCPKDHLPIILGSIIVALFGLLVALAAILYLKYSQEIKVWLFAKGWCLWLITEDNLDEDKKYDAFISFSQRDEELVTEHLIPELESGEFPYKLCIHHRDWVIGDLITDQITRSVEESRKTIVVLSKSFLESVWTRAEFKAAHQAAMREGRARVIMILFGDIGELSHLDQELQTYLKTNTYVKWGDEWFWRKLRYALRRPISARGQVKSFHAKHTISSSVDDKLELIVPSPVTPTLTTPPAETAGTNPLMTKLKINGDPVGQQQQQQQPPPSSTSPPLPANGKLPNGLNGHVNGAFIINTNAKQSDV